MKANFSICALHSIWFLLKDFASNSSPFFFSPFFCISRLLASTVDSGHTNLYNHMSQWLIINLLLYIYKFYWFCFLENPAIQLVFSICSIVWWKASILHISLQLALPHFWSCPPSFVYFQGFKLFSLSSWSLHTCVFYLPCVYSLVSLSQWFNITLHSTLYRPLTH